MPGDYFMTMDTTEASTAIKNLGYGNEQIVCWMYLQQAANIVPFFRLSGPGGHFYTASEAEQQALVQGGAWSLDGVAGYLYPTPADGTCALYRLCGPGSVHLYTTSAAERDGLALCPGWTYEGPAGYVYAQATSGTAEMLRLWKPDSVPVYPPWVQGDQDWSLYFVINNSPYPLLVSGSRGSDLHNVALGQVIPPFGGSLEVAKMHWGLGDRHDWVYLTDLVSPQRYQIYADFPVGTSHHASFGYFDSGSSQSHSNPSPFPDGTATAQWGGKGYWLYTINNTPLLQRTDLQAVTDQLGYILAGPALEWTASTSYDSKSHPELAPYISQQVQAVPDSEPTYAPNNQWTITKGSTEEHPGCYQNSSPTATTYTYQTTLTRTTQFTWSVTETLSVMFKYSTTVGLPADVDKTTTEWQITVGFSATQSQTVTKTLTIQENIPISIPPQTTTVWNITFTDQSYSIPFTVPVQLTGAVAIKSNSAVASAALNAAGAQQIQSADGGFLVIAPLGSLLNYGTSLNAGLAALPFTYVSANQANYAMGGVIVGGPDVVDDIATQQYSNNGVAPACSNCPPISGRQAAHSI